MTEPKPTAPNADAHVDVDADVHVDVEAGKNRASRIELISVVLIALTSILTAWSAFQSTKWSGEMSIRFNQAGASRTESVRQSNIADRQLTLDVSLISTFAEALAHGDIELAEVYQARFPDHLAVAVEAWAATDPLVSPDAPGTPFDMPEYRLEAADEAERLAQRADDLAQQAQKAGSRSDRYTLTSVMYASVILLAALAVKVGRIALQRRMLLGAGLLLAATVLTLATFPIKL